MTKRPVLVAWAFALLWMAVIALESFTGSSENTARVLRPVLEFIFGPLRAHTFELVHGALRKGGHCFGYATLSFTQYRAVWTTLQARRDPEQLSWRAMFSAWNWRGALVALLVTLAFAGLDEWHQSYLASRTGSVRDVVLDEFGGCLAQLAILTLSKPSVPSAGRPTKEPATISS